MAFPRTLLLTSLDPLMMHGGTVLQSELLSHCPPGSVAGFSLVGAMNPARPERIEGHGLTYAVAPPEQPPTRWPGRLRRCLNPAWARWVAWRAAPALVDEAVRLGRRHRAEMVWAWVQRPALILISGEVARRLGLPLAVSVTDPPERFEREIFYGPRTMKFIMARFDRLLADCDRLSVASEAMGRAYAGRYGKREPAVLIHGAADEDRLPAAETLAEPGWFTIGVGGSIYAHAEWRALLGALGRAGWRIGGRRVRIRLLGSCGAPATEGPMQIELLGWRPYAEALRILAGCDVNYVPYWFDPAFGPSVRMCFPNKLATYAAAGRPVFYHGPREAVPAEFIERWGAGVSVHSLEPDAILAALERLAGDGGFYASAARGAARAAAEQLSRAVLRRNFARLAGVEEQDLAAMAQAVRE